MFKCFLVLTHKNIDHIYKLAASFPDANFYVHVDLKADINKIKKDASDVRNIFFLENRVDIKWAGFSMVQATLNLIEYALKHDQKNEYFHLISGDDVLLIKSLLWEDNCIFMECKESQRHRYRIRFDTPHADSKYQRMLIGKALTQIFKVFDRIIPTREKHYFGSQWFSIRRNELETLMKSITIDDLNFFRKKLCPDEHFFQYLVVKNNFLDKISNEGNKRHIIFDANYQHGSSPVFLSVDQLREAKKRKFWFARKVDPKVMCEFFSLEND